MTTYKFPDALSVANTFASKLLTGTLNVHDDYDSPEKGLVDVSYETSWFSTAVMWQIRVMFSDHELAKLTASELPTPPEEMWHVDQVRNISIYTRSPIGLEERVATFDVVRRYVDGENAEGWTKWHVKNVILTIHGGSAKLVSEQPDPDDHQKIVWGTRINS